LPSVNRRATRRAAGIDHVGIEPASPARFTVSGNHFKEGTMASSMLISILITFLVIILVLYLVQRLPLDARMRQIVQVIVIIIGIISLLRYLAVF
jgi:hypothetical protein